MTEVMTQQYIRTARLKGVSFRQGRDAPRAAECADRALHRDHAAIPVALERLGDRGNPVQLQSFGWTLVQAAGNNDIDTLLACSVVAVFVVLVTQLISDIGYVFLNPRIRLA